MQKTYEVVLGDKTFTVDAPLTFKQLRIVEPAISKIVELRKNGIVPEAYVEMAKIIVACISRRYPDFTTDALDNTPTTPAELITAFRVIGVASGLMKEAQEGDNALGEAQAEILNP